MRDQYKGLRDTLLNFQEYVRKHGLSAANSEAARAHVDAFLDTQHPDHRTLVPCCGHCGGDDVVAGDFSTQKTFDRHADMTLPDAHGDRLMKPRTMWTGPPTGATGPAWICRGKDCGAYTVRVVDGGDAAEQKTP